MITLAMLIGWGTSFCSFATGAIDTYKKAKDATQAKPETHLLLGKVGAEGSISKSQLVKLKSLYGALDDAAPMAARLLRQSLYYAIFRSALFTIVWACGVTWFLYQMR